MNCFEPQTQPECDVRLAPALVLTAVLATACGHTSPPVASGPITLSLWTHGGTPGEQSALRSTVSAYQRDHPSVTVAVRVVPEGEYNDTLQAATGGGQLPDVLDVDGPLVAAYAYQGALAPLDSLISTSVRARTLPSLLTQGTWNGSLWALGAFDSGLALYADRAALTRAGVRIPTGIGDAWTASQMAAVLHKLAARDPDHKVLDLKRDYGVGEWLTYGFAPLVSSAGGSLLDPVTGTAGGYLDSPAAVLALTTLQSWAPYVDDDKDGKAFTSRRVPLSWVGHWTYPDYAAALGKNLVLLPLPDLGQGTKSGQGSWAWAVGATSRHQQAAASLLMALTDDAAATAMTRANGAVPGTQAALAASVLVAPGKPLHLYADQLAHPCGRTPVTRECVTVPRPATPAYPTVTAAFSWAVSETLKGAPVQATLTRAAQLIDKNIADNHGYMGR
jgi:multiple sugar transport system substrate-binding protein